MLSARLRHWLKLRDTYRRNDFIGSTTIELQKYEPDKTHKLDLKLTDKKDEDVGRIELVISVTGMQADYQDQVLSSQPHTEIINLDAALNNAHCGTQNHEVPSNTRL